ncbi:MAG: S9 family peptidase [Bacteroidota bacterium]
MFAVNLDGSNFKSLTDFDGVRTQIIDDLEDDEDHLLIALNKRDKRAFDPYRLNIVTGGMEMLTVNPGNITNWLTDHDGKLRIAIATDGVNSSLLYREKEKDDFTEILTNNFKENLQPLFFTFDNKNLYAASNIGRDKMVIVIFNIDKREETEVLFEHSEVDVSTMTFSRKRKKLTTIWYYMDKLHREFLDDEVKKIFDYLQSELGDYEIRITGYNKDETKFIVRAFSDRSLGAYYFYDMMANDLKLIEDVGSWLEEDIMAEMKPIQYQSRDGLTIHGYLTLPVGREPGNLPVVINPHGGPWVRDNWHFNPEVQFLANRGYAVLQMNYRGSTGYGKKFWEASFKQWGKKMQDDITDGVQWLIKEGIADPKRIAIYGGSYGGYATLSGLTFTPELYACGVDYVGVSNLFTFMKSIPPYWEPFLEMMYEMVGHPQKDSVLLASTSPVFHADKISVPLLIAQGAKDPRVNKNESDQMVAAMKERGIEVEYLVEPEEGHGFRNEENRFKFYEAMEKFLGKHIGENVQ